VIFLIMVDILNATQTVFQVKSEYVTLLTTQAESILSLLHLVSPESGDTLVVADRFLFAR
jgi:hypothetical protein